jgi:hypothetical protein
MPARPIKARDKETHIATVTFDQQLPAQIPRILPIYAVAPPAFPLVEMETIAHSWPDVSLERARTRSVGDWVSADYGQLRLLYQQVSGAVQASVRAAGARVSGGTRSPIPDDKVVEIARAFLAKTSLAEDAASELTLGKITHLWQQAASSDGVEPPEILDAGVQFARMIDETPVIGPGGYVMVKVLPRATIGGASRVFRRRGAKIATVRVLPGSDALAAFEQRLRSRQLNSSVRVTRAQFGYFEAGPSQRQRFFEPAYAFVFVTDGPEPLKSVEVIQASGSNRGFPGGTTA